MHPVIEKKKINVEIFIMFRYFYKLFFKTESGDYFWIRIVSLGRVNAVTLLLSPERQRSVAPQDDDKNESE
jgi:hypothetical protein